MLLLHASSIASDAKKGNQALKWFTCVGDTV